jgi:hypothetical protein
MSKYFLTKRIFAMKKQAKIILSTLNLGLEQVAKINQADSGRGRDGRRFRPLRPIDQFPATVHPNLQLQFTGFFH